ncbi:MAG: UBP-type zinc finger domain-containing protein [Chloroflexi bacterium]|nr:UBP-type zinc finger domain-containing protein [Chloroflexota bacterium]
MASSSETVRCTHVPPSIAAPTGARCEECGSDYDLRLCTECGHVGCCESQAGHARAHALDHQHPVIKSLPLEPRHFTWCYDCDRYV